MVRVLWEQAAALVLLASMATWLAGTLRLARSQWGMMAVAAVSAIIGLVPMGGVSAAGMVLSLSPSLSVAGTVLWGALLMGRMRPGGPGSPRHAQGLALLIISVSLPVYVSFIGGIGPDIYGSGYGFTLWDIILGASAVMLFIRGIWISLVLMACLLAHALAIMSSANIFDTLVDGPAFFLSVVLLLMAWFPRRQSLPNPPGL